MISEVVRNLFPKSGTLFRQLYKEKEAPENDRFILCRRVFWSNSPFSYAPLSSPQSTLGRSSSPASTVRPARVDDS